MSPDPQAGGDPGPRTHLSRGATLPYWLLDCATDPRVVHNLPATLRRRAARVRALEAAPQPPAGAGLTLSFDIERDSDQPAESSRSRTAEPFLWAFLERTQGTPLRAEFFVQGEMVEGLSAPLRALHAAGHGVGLHGWRHELWGRTNWITRRPPITGVERALRLSQSLAAFRRAGLPAPTSFRAPNFTTEPATYRLLARHGLRLDSSRPSQRGDGRGPHRVHGVTVLPVSCAPLAEVHRHPRLGLPTAARFRQFNFDTYLKLRRSELRELVSQTLRFQALSDQRPYLMMYAHNWEFDAGGEFLGRLVERSLNLVEQFGMRAATLSDLAGEAGTMQTAHPAPAPRVPAHLTTPDRAG